MLVKIYGGPCSRLAQRQQNARQRRRRRTPYLVGDAKDGWPAVINNNAHAPVRLQGYYGKIPNGVLTLAFGPKGELLSAGRDKQVRLWNPSGGAVKSFASETALPLQTSITFDGQGLYAGDASGAVRYWAAEK